MCGICGLVRQDGAPVERGLLEKMNNALLHRGPDGEGYYYHPGVGLAMRRLAIIDLITGDQPICNEDGTLWVVYNGEIYNFLSLRSELEKRGHHFKTRSDTECLLHLYEEYGDNCVDHLRGMFAFALWDEGAQRLLVARDRLGKKPIYYTERDGVFYFSSELPSLLLALRQAGASLDISLPAIDYYLSLQYIPEPYTPFEQVYKLPAAHRLVWQRGSCRLECYWQLSYSPKWSISEQEAASELGVRLREAVRLRLISDVPLGAHLSGGIDSSIIVALMAEASSQPVKTFSVGFEDEAFSELQYARLIAERYATEHHEFILTYGDVPATLEQLVRYLGEPLGDPSILPLYHLSRLTREFVTVALNGDGGDEALAGYQRYWLDPWANRYLWLPGAFTRGIVPALVHYLPDRADLPIGGSLANGFKRLEQISQIDPRASILRWGSYFTPRQKGQLWKQDQLAHLQVDNVETFITERFERAPAETFLDRTMYTDITTYLPGDLLVKADRMTMASSLEGRSPFLDHELAAWVARLPGKMKVRGLQGKVLLRKTFADLLPEQIQRRGKQGFGIPVSAWFRGPLVSWTREVLLDQESSIMDWFNPEYIEKMLSEHASGRMDHGKRLWALAVLGMWSRTFVWDLR